ncbi:MAG: amidohydrolase [bacterium]|nr:amidohydrolase [bacterium]
MTRSRRWSCRALVMGLSMTAVSACSAPQADLVIVNARVWTAVADAPTAEAVAVSGDRIVAVGSEAAVRRRVGPDTRVIDAGGAAVIPGLIDCHTHIIWAGLELARLQLREVAGREEFIAVVKAAAEQMPPGQWVVGGQWSIESWAQPMPPARDWIDPVTGDTPVFLTRMDGHQGLANSAALKLAGIDENGPPDPPGGEIERDPTTGRPTGILKDDAMALVNRHIPPVDQAQQEAALLRAMKQANCWGITSVHDMSVPSDLACFAAVRDKGQATVRIRSFVEDQDWSRQHETVRSFASDEWVTLAGFKGYMDGSLGSRTAYMDAPYADASPDAKNPAGFLVAMSDPVEKMRDRLLEADRGGFQAAVHAIGDRANGLLLDCYEAVNRVNGPGDRRFRIEHAQHLRPRDIPRFAELGVVASLQPYHKADDGRYAEAALGLERCKTSYAFRDLLDAGAKVGFGSDWPVVSANPFLGLATAVNARTLAGEVWVPEQSITLDEALRAYTADAAYAGFAEDRLGSLKVGKLADIVVLNRDPFAMPPAELENLGVTHTIVDGRVVWSAPSE